MNQLIKDKIENCIDQSPLFLKKIYVQFAIFLKWMLKKITILDYMDKQAKQNPHYHYVRSLLAIHQLEDMIFLDVPWWTYGAIEFVEQYLQNLEGRAMVFEYGSGASTIWLAKRSAKVVSIEHDRKWYDRLESFLIPYPHVELILKTPDLSLDGEYASAKLKGVNFKSYVNAIHSSDLHYDLIIIDGRSRAACLKTAVAHLKPNGVILFDNSNRKRYQAILNSIELNKKRYHGLVPGSPFKSETAILSYSHFTQKMPNR